MKQRFGSWGLVVLMVAAVVASCSIHPPVGFIASADIQTLQKSSNLQSSGTSSSCVVAPGSTGSCVVIRCPAGQSTAQVYVAAGTLSGVVTVYTASDVAGVPGTYGTPPWSAAPGGTSSTTSLNSFPGSLTVTLGSTQWVEAVLTTATSGNATATITCSAAVAVQHGSGGGGGGGTVTEVDSGPGITGGPITGSGTLSLDIPVSVAHGGTGTSSPNPTATATACGAPVSGGGFPSYSVSVPVCPTSSPFSQATPAAGNCIGISTPPAAGTIAYTCASPTTAPSVAAGNCITISTPPAQGTINVSGTGCTAPPLPLSVANGGTGTSSPNPIATATACGAPVTMTGTWPSQTTLIPVCPTAAPTPNYVSVMLAETSMTHFYKFTGNTVGSTPGPCATSFADSISAGATAAPSPVPLTLATGAPQCGFPGVIQDGNTSMVPNNSGATAASWFSGDSSIIQTICNVSGGTCNLPFSVECVYYPSITNIGASRLFAVDAGQGLVPNYAALTGTLAVFVSNASKNAVFTGMEPVDFVYTFDGASTTKFYANGLLVGSIAASPAHVNAATVTFGGDAASTGASWTGRMQYCATFNAALTTQQVQAHFKATGFR